MTSRDVLTVLRIDRLREPGILLDAGRKGLRLVATISDKTGGLRRVWKYRYRKTSGVLTQIHIGEYPTISLERARQIWEKLKADRDDPTKGDPKAEIARQKAAEKAADEQRKRDTYSLAALCEDYLREHVEKRRKRVDEPRRLLDREVVASPIGRMPALEVKRLHVHDLIQKIVARPAPRIAQMVRTELRAAFDHAVTAGRLPDEHFNPCLKVKAPPQVRRKRAFSEEELQKFLKWLPKATASRSICDAMLLEILTAARQGEIVAMQWAHVDLKRAIWTQPDSKNGRRHEVMLSSQACKLIAARKGLHPSYVFPLPNGRGHIASKAVGFQQYTAKEGLGILDWTVHDLRRSALTGLARLGCSRVVQDRIANHVDSSMAAIYDTHTYNEQAREWLQRWADHLDGLRSGVERRIKRVRPLALAA